MYKSAVKQAALSDQLTFINTVMRRYKISLAVNAVLLTIIALLLTLVK